MAEDKGCLQKRDVLWYFVFWGFGINYMVRINLNIAIVAMVKQRGTAINSAAKYGECINDYQMSSIKTLDNTLTTHLPTTIDFNQSTDISTENKTESPLKALTDLMIKREVIYKQTKKKRLFDWDEYEQGLILGAFFWLHWLTQIPGGILAQKYGTKLVFGLANFSAVVCCFIIPFSAYLDYKCLIFIRVIQGLVTGFAWPAMHNMTAKWIPPNERGKFVTAYLGSSVGAAFTFPLCGFIIALWGWEPVFYATGVIGTLWFTCWWLYVFDSPAEHPQISEYEKNYITTSLGRSISTQKEKAPTPWRDILTSVPVWMNILAQWGGVWGLLTLMTHGPSYFKFIHGLNIRANGIFSGLPHLLRTIFAYVFSMFGDYLLASDKMTRTNVRKLATAFCTFGQGICMLGLAYSGCDYTTAIVCFTIATAIHGAVSSGPLASLVDISPNYASVALGIAGTIVVTTGLISPILTGLLVNNNQTIERWRWVFLIATGWLFLCGALYMMFSKSDLEPWNDPNRRDKDEEMVSLKPKEYEALKNTVEEPLQKNLDDTDLKSGDIKSVDVEKEQKPIS